MHQQPRKFPKTLVVRYLETDDENLRQLAARLDLPFSEAARRALRLGSKFLSEVNFPGSGSVREVNK